MSRVDAAVVTLFLLAFFALPSCDHGSSHQAATGSETSIVTTTPQIQSSLDGLGPVLPRHVRWTVTTSVPADEIKDVAFLIDRRRIWIDTEAPYNFGEEGAYLVTPGYYWPKLDKRGVGHRFVVRVDEVDGGHVRKSVLARVPEPPPVPKGAPAYGMVWGRLTRAELEHPRPVGTLERKHNAVMLLTANELLVSPRFGPHGFLYSSSFLPHGRLRVDVPIFSGSQEEGGTISGWRYKGSQCRTDDPPAMYRWSFSKPFQVGRYRQRYFVLRALHEPCNERQRILAGSWEGLD
jgi:hypothetical protein